MKQHTRHLAIDARQVRARPGGVGTAILRQLDGLDRFLKQDELGGWKVTVFRYGPDLRYTNFREQWQRYTSLNIVDCAADPSRHPAGDIWQQFSLPRILRRLGVDVLYSPAFWGPLFLRRPAHLLMIHDDLIWSHADSYPLRFRLYLQTMARLSARAADHIIFPSEDARRRVRARLRLASAKTSVVPHGIEVPGAPAPPLEGREPFALCIANDERRKNQEVLIRAVRGMRDFKVLFLGIDSRNTQRIMEFEEAGPKGKWSMAPPVSRQGLIELLQMASMVTLPSRAEGFGLPVLEAMACGTPLLLSDIEVFHEVAGDAALYLPPDNPRAWRDAMEQARRGGEEAQARVSAGLARLEKFTLERNTRALLTAAEAALAAHKLGRATASARAQSISTG